VLAWTLADIFVLPLRVARTSTHQSSDRRYGFLCWHIPCVERW